jgi:hypothetical protein
VAEQPPRGLTVPSPVAERRIFRRRRMELPARADGRRNVRRCRGSYPGCVRRRRSLGLIIAALWIAGCASSHSQASSKGASTTETLNTGSAAGSGGFGTPQAVPSGRVLVAVSGDSPALITLTVDGNTQQVQVNTLPWETTVSAAARDIAVKAETQSGSTSAHISCSVVPSNGAAPTLENGTPGAHSTVSCIHGSGGS